MRFELTKRADYAIRATLALSRAADGARLSVRRIAADERVPERFLPQVMGDLVRAGQQIAKAGSTGRSTGAHVHFEVWDNGRVVNPRQFLSGRSAVRG